MMVVLLTFHQPNTVNMHQTDDEDLFIHIHNMHTNQLLSVTLLSKEPLNMLKFQKLHSKNKQCDLVPGDLVIWSAVGVVSG